MVITKHEDVAIGKQGFCKILRWKLGLWESLLLVLIQFSGRLHVLTFSAIRMGAYSRWTLIRGWALIQINTVSGEIILKYTCTYDRKQAKQNTLNGKKEQQKKHSGTPCTLLYHYFEVNKYTVCDWFTT